jgi:hypothetical protein
MAKSLSTNQAGRRDYPAKPASCVLLFLQAAPACRPAAADRSLSAFGGLRSDLPDSSWGLCPQRPGIYRFMANGTGGYDTLAAMEDRALLGSNPSAMAGPYGTGGVLSDAACFIAIAVGPHAINPKPGHVLRVNSRHKRFNSFHGPTAPASIPRGVRCLGHFPMFKNILLDNRSRGVVE